MRGVLGAPADPLLKDALNELVESAAACRRAGELRRAVEALHLRVSVGGTGAGSGVLVPLEGCL